VCVDVPARLKSWSTVIVLALQFAGWLVAYGRLDAKVEDLQHEVQELRADVREQMRQK
jgi:hypothetical protein